MERRFRMDRLEILDCTLRDGGLTNDFFFDDLFVKDLYLANVEAGVGYMEMGYRASKDVFDVDRYGKWKFCDEEDIRRIVGDDPSQIRLSVMADVGRTDFQRDILPKKDSVLDMIRIATYSHTIDEAVEAVEHCHGLGYETTVNIMAVSNDTEETILHVLERLAGSSVDVVYLVDSFGSIYPYQIAALARQYADVLCPAGKQVGIHAHNNQQLAFANTIEGMRNGASLLDVTVNGLGRGAGNCPMELLVGYLMGQGIPCREEPFMHFIQEHMPALKKDGVVWGYDIPYLLTGQRNQHPSKAIEFIKECRTQYTDLLKELAV